MVQLLLIFCLLLIPLKESVIVLCFVVRYFMSIIYCNHLDGEERAYFFAWFVFLVSHARIQEFSSGGGGGPGQSDKKALFFFFFFTSPQLILQKSNGQFHRNLSFFNVPGGSNFFQGAGVQLLIPYINPFNLWFSRGEGVRTPYPPSGSALVSRDCCVALSRGAMGLSAVCDCGIS